MPSLFSFFKNDKPKKLCRHNGCGQEATHTFSKGGYSYCDKHFIRYKEIFRNQLAERGINIEFTYNEKTGEDDCVTSSKSLV